MVANQFEGTLNRHSVHSVYTTLFIDSRLDISVKLVCNTHSLFITVQTGMKFPLQSTSEQNQ